MKTSTIFCFIGMDGSGKTTLITTIGNRLTADGVPYEYIWAGWKGFESCVFKPFVIQYKKRFPRDTDFRSYRKENIFFDFIVLLDYTLRVMPEFITARLKGRLILMDRSFYDLTLDNIHSPTLQRGIILFIDLFIPRCTIFFINVPYALAYERKKGDFKDPEKAKSMYEKYQDLYSRFGKFKHMTVIPIDNTNPLEIVVDEIMNHMLRTGG